jgi:hypothetical protein
MPYTQKDKRKKKILQDLARVRMAIINTADKLPPSKQSAIFLGIWSPRHLIAHLIGWDYTNITAATELNAGRLPTFYEHHDRDWSSYNNEIIGKRNRGSYKNLLLVAKRSHQKLLSFMEGISSTEYFLDRNIKYHGWRVTIERLLLSEVKDEKIHLSQLRHYSRKK